MPAKNATAVKTATKPKAAPKPKETAASLSKTLGGVRRVETPFERGLLKIKRLIKFMANKP